MKLEQGLPSRGTNLRQDYLLHPSLGLERFGNEQFVGNLNVIQRLIVENGTSKHNEGYYVWELSTARDDNGDYAGLMHVPKPSLKKRNTAMILHKTDSRRVVFGESYARLDIWSDNKIDIEVNSTGYPEAIDMKTAEENLGRSVEIKNDTVIIQDAPVEKLSRQTVAVLNNLTSVMLLKFQKYLADPRREKESQILPNLPVDTEDRTDILRQLRNIVRLDRGHFYPDRRHENEYIRTLYGIEGTFSYLNALGTSNKIVDVGAGFGEAILGITREYGGNLEVYGTNLTYNPNLTENLGKGRASVTPAEFMKGFEDESIAGIIAVNSIAYSVAPKLVIQRLDQILVPGGVIKATFRNPKRSDMEEYGFQTHNAFTKYLKELGYDVALFRDCVVLAIKPGGELNVKARTLLEEDLESYKRSGLDKSWRSNTPDGSVIYHQSDRGDFP